MCMLEVIIEGILINHNDIKTLSKYINKTTSIFYIGLITGGYLLYKFNKNLKKQDAQISELKKELEEIKTKGE